MGADEYVVDPSKPKTIREYSIFLRVPMGDDPEGREESALVLRICDAMTAAGFDGDDWDFGDTRYDIDDETGGTLA